MPFHKVNTPSNQNSKQENNIVRAVEASLVILLSHYYCPKVLVILTSKSIT